MTVNEKIDQLLRSPDKAQRVSAASGFREFDYAYERIIPALVEALRDLHADVRQAAITSLMSIWQTLHAPSFSPSEPFSSIEPSSPIEPALPEHDPDRLFESVLPVLKTLLQDKDKHVRVAAAEALRNLYSADADVLQIFIESARDADEHVRRQAAYAFWQGASDLRLVSSLAAPFLGGGRGPLHGVDTEPVIEVLIELAQDPSRDVREYSINAISSIGPPANAAAPALIQALEDQDEVVRFKAAGALASIGSSAPPALAALVEGLTDTDRLKRKAASFALRAMGAAVKPATADLIGALQDEELHVRARCARALGNIGPEVGDVAIHALLALEKDREHIVRAAASQALEAVGKEAVDAAQHRLAGRLAKDTYPLEGFKADDIPGLIGMLRDSNANIRAFAATALRHAPGDTRTAIPDLIALLEDDDEDVRRRAAETLKGLGEIN